MAINLEEGEGAELLGQVRKCGGIAPEDKVGAIEISRLAKESVQVKGSNISKDPGPKACLSKNKQVLQSSKASSCSLHHRLVAQMKIIKTTPGGAFYSPFCCTRPRPACQVILGTIGKAHVVPVYQSTSRMRTCCPDLGDPEVTRQHNSETFQRSEIRFSPTALPAARQPTKYPFTSVSTEYNVYNP